MASIQNDQKKLSDSLTKTISSSELGKVGEDITEVAIDSILQEGILKEIPIIGTLTGLWKTGVAVKDYLFLTKLLAFLNESSKLSTEKRAKLVEELEEEPFQSEAGEKLIAIIDQLETTSKAKLLGKALCLFGNDEITKEEFWRVSFVISKLPFNDILAIKKWAELDLMEVNNIRAQLYLSVGVGRVDVTISSGGLHWIENLCRIFSDKLLK